jgi:hypothetical protein
MSGVFLLKERKITSSLQLAYALLPFFFFSLASQQRQLS